MKFAFCLLALVAVSFAKRSLYVKYDAEELAKKAPPAQNPPLFLNLETERNGAEAARAAAKVTNIGNYTSYSGFYQVDEDTDNNLFVWYFPAQNGDKNAPLLIWLQGGPGGASTFGLFSEIGPFSVDADGNLEPRDTTWNEKYSLLFIDNPVGAGFSYTSKDGYAKDSRNDVASDLYTCLQAFYKTFPNELSNDLYITGESYAGHYIPAFGAFIHNQNAAGTNPKVPLKGVSIGDGWTDPGPQTSAIPGLIYNLGLADPKQLKTLQAYCDQAIVDIENKNFLEAFKVWDLMLNGDVYPYPTFFYNLTGCTDYDNFLNTVAPASFGYYADFLMKHRDDLHVGNATMQSGLTCEMNLINDVMDSYKPELDLLADNYKVLLYNGQLDLIVGVPLTEAYLPTMQWSGVNDFINSNRSIWKVDSSDVDVAGYVRSVNDFHYVVVRGAGHIAPYDQGRRVKDMVTRFVEGKPYTA